MGGAPTARASFPLLQEWPEVQQGLRRQSPLVGGRRRVAPGSPLSSAIISTRTRTLPLPSMRLPALASNLDGFQHRFAFARNGNSTSEFANAVVSAGVHLGTRQSRERCRRSSTTHQRSDQISPRQSPCTFELWTQTPRSVQSISTAFVESAVNEVLLKRMIKKQQMRWNRWTVHPFLGVRVAVLNKTLAGSFRRLYPDFHPDNGNCPVRLSA